MKLTEKHFKLAISDNGGYSYNQMSILGIDPNVSTKKWKKRVIGKDYPQETIELFISLKNKHLNN